MSTLSPTRLILLFISTVSLPACNWVDSTGNQGIEIDADSVTSISNVNFESATASLQEGEALTLIENSTSTTQLLNDISNNGVWSWELRAEGENARCNGINGFDSTVAGSTLLSSCTDPTRCEVRIEPASAQSNYIIELPSLAAPVALTYLLKSELSDGARVEREQIVCALSVNEAPTAVNDSYRTIVGTLLDVDGADADSLLANDSDDIDVRNQPLQVDTNVASAPQYASMFRLQRNGGFIYQPGTELPFDNSGTLIDSFIYRISDGLHTATATVTIRIRAINQAPVAEDISNRFVRNDFEYDISGFFSDPDGDELTFSTQQLPQDVSLSTDGVLTGRSSNRNVGAWFIVIVAEDGFGGSVSDGFLLNIR